MSKQVKYETDHICFLRILLQLKEKDEIRRRRNINNNKKKKYIYVKSVLLLFWFAEN